MLDLDSDLGAARLMELWEKAPAPEKAMRVREATVATQVLELLRRRPVQAAPGTAKAATAHIRTLITRIRLVNQQLKDAHCQLDTMTHSLRHGETAEPEQARKSDVDILASLPGAGKIVLGTLLSEAFDPIKRRDYCALRTLTGVAPVTKSSGKSRVVVRRQAYHNRLANATYHWGRIAIQHGPVSRGKYAALRKRGQSRGRALRSVADRLLNVACAMLKSGTLSDPLLARAQGT